MPTFQPNQRLDENVRFSDIRRLTDRGPSKFAHPFFSPGPEVFEIFFFKLIDLKFGRTFNKLTSAQFWLSVQAASDARY